MKNEMVIKCEMEAVRACWWGEIREVKASGLEKGWNGAALQDLWRHSGAFVSLVTGLNKVQVIYFHSYYSLGPLQVLLPLKMWGH